MLRFQASVCYIAGWKPPVTLEDREDFDALMGQAVDDAVIPFEDLSDHIRSQFGNLAADGGVRRQAVAAFQEFGDEARRSSGRIRGDEIVDFSKPFQRLFRPNDFHLAYLAFRRAVIRR